MDIAEFLQIYHHYPCLWDRSHPDFKDRTKRNEAEADILEMTEFTDVKELRNKIKNIRGTYTQEVNKIKASHASGLAEYKPKLSWFNVADSFLRKNYDCMESPEVNTVSSIMLERKILNNLNGIFTYNLYFFINSFREELLLLTIPLYDNLKVKENLKLHLCILLKNKGKNVFLRYSLVLRHIEITLM